MCFRIKTDLPRPTQTTVYKLVHATHFSTIFLPLYRYSCAVPFEKGVRYDLPEDINSVEFHENGAFSKEGYYFYLSLDTAKEELRSWGDHTVVVECAVSPRDFLHQGLDAHEAHVGTYRGFTLRRIVATKRDVA